MRRLEEVAPGAMVMVAMAGEDTKVVVDMEVDKTSIPLHLRDCQAREVPLLQASLTTLLSGPSTTGHWACTRRQR